jgi:hypothetical protein
MAARLMGKAHGGIYIDDSTFNRLPFSVMSSLRELEPMMVKGKATPLLVHSYVSPHLLQLRTVDLADYEVRAVCKRVLLKQLEEIAASSEGALSNYQEHNFSDDSAASNDKGRALVPSSPLRRTTTYANAFNKRVLSFVLMEGRIGAGKSTTMKWFRNVASEKDVRYASVSLEHRDCVNEFRVFELLFRELLGKEVFDDNNKQRRAVLHILRHVYGDDKNGVEQHAYFVMQKLFSISCNIHGSGYTINEATKKEPLLHQVFDTLLRVFTFLLNEIPTIVVVENIHFADEMSLVAFVRMRTIRTKSTVIFTAIGPEDFDEIGGSTLRSPLSATKHSFENDSNDDVNLPSTLEWIETYRKVQVDYTENILITLGCFTVDEIREVLPVYITEKSVPTGLAELVFKLTGGDTFWVKEMLIFIKNTGASGFMKSMQSRDEPQLRAPSSKIKTSFHGRVGFSPLSVNTSIRSAKFSGTYSKEEETNRSQLELFLVCRLETLTPDEQKIVRTASIIGGKFSRYILYGVLTHHLKTRMYACLRALLKQNWLVIAPDDDSVYSFTHPMMQKTLYNLTPASDRVKIHHSIAEYVEETNPDDPHRYNMLSLHYSYCDAEKAFEYTVRSACRMFGRPNFRVDIIHFFEKISSSFRYCSTYNDAKMVTSLLESAEEQYYRRGGQRASAGQGNGSTSVRQASVVSHDSSNSTSHHGSEKTKHAANASSSRKAPPQVRYSDRPSLLVRIVRALTCVRNDVVPEASTRSVKVTPARSRLRSDTAESVEGSQSQSNVGFMLSPSNNNAENTLCSYAGSDFTQAQAQSQAMYISKSKEFITKAFSRLQHDAEELEMELKEQKGELKDWQRRILGLEVDEYQDESSASYVSMGVDSTSVFNNGSKKSVSKRLFAPNSPRS